jgi:hypothetical protein
VDGQASGAQNAIRELGGVFGVAVLASVQKEPLAEAAPNLKLADLGA